MDDVIDDIDRAARRCERASRRLEDEPTKSTLKQFSDAVSTIGDASSGSWIGYQANVYTADLQPKRPGDYFDTMHGASDGRREWAEFNYESILDAAQDMAGVTKRDLDAVSAAANEIVAVVEECRNDLLPTFDALLSTKDDAKLRELRDKLAEIPLRHLARVLIEAYRPRGSQIVMDMRAIQGGSVAPPHVGLQGWIFAQVSAAQQAKKVAEMARYTSNYLKKAMKMKGRSVAKTDGPIFIGHGRSNVWKDLKDFIQDRLSLQWEEFNRESTAGRSNKERLLEMLDKCPFAFLVMTAEDEQVDGSLRARENVVHEVGLFQGRYGFERAIVLLEEGCQEFTNINGVGQIRFPKGNIIAKSEDIRRVLEREKLIG